MQIVGYCQKLAVAVKRNGVARETQQSRLGRNLPYGTFEKYQGSRVSKLKTFLIHFSSEKILNFVIFGANLPNFYTST